MAPGDSGECFDDGTGPGYDGPYRDGDGCGDPYDPDGGAGGGYDLDRSDVDGPIVIEGSDPHGFDRDGDGIGCEAG